MKRTSYNVSCQTISDGNADTNFVENTFKERNNVLQKRNLDLGNNLKELQVKNTKITVINVNYNLQIYFNINF